MRRSPTRASSRWRRRTRSRRYGLVPFPKTSGKRGIHVYCRIAQEWTFADVRRAALAVAREVEKRIPKLVTTAWWREERHGGVFMDYNQNARDRTIASAYSVRPTPNAQVSCPLRWDEVPDVEPRDLTINTVPARIASLGDPGGEIDEHVGRLDALLELADKHKAEGLDEAPEQPKRARREPTEKGQGRWSRRRRATDE